MTTVDFAHEARLTFLFTDIEGSTSRWEADAAAMSAALALHDAVLRTTIENHGGQVFKTVGDAFCAAFDAADDAVAAAIAAQRDLGCTDWPIALGGLRVRFALHAGPAEARGGDYFGPALNRVARMLATAHGSQILVSGTIHEQVVGAGAGLAEFKDLGEHRLKDLARPERIFQVVAPGLPTEFPPIRSLDRARHNLPIQISRFVGRERELSEIRQLLSANRLVTLTGVGGGGKTRIALQLAAERMDAYPDGAWLVELTALVHGSQVIDVVAAALGVRERPSQPLLDAVVDHLQTRRLLLIVDNCEHVIADAAILVETLLARAPGVSVLATSRERLAIPGEAAWTVPRLSVPSTRWLGVDEALRSEAVQLFVDRAVLVQPTFALTAANGPAVAAIARRLDGIPLALELAAARVGLLSPAQIERRLDQRFQLLTTGSRTALPRHRTLAATIDWSFALLDEVEQCVLARLAVFSGGVALEAAEAVCAGNGVAPADVVDGIAGLVAKSLVVADATGDSSRFRMLETIRDYALEKLAASGDETLARWQHASWCRQAFRAVVASDEADGAFGAQIRAFTRLEVDNLRSALEFSLGEAFQRPSDVAIEFALDAIWSLPIRSHEKAGLFDKARRAAMEGGHASLGAMATYHAGNAREIAGLGSGIELLCTALEAFRNLGMRQAESWAIQDIGNALLNLGDADGASERFRQSVEIKRAVAPPWDVGIAVCCLGEAERLRGNLAAAALHFDEALALSDGNLYHAVYPLINLCVLALHARDLPAARTLLARAIRASQDIDSDLHASSCLFAAGCLFASLGEGIAAARLFGALDALLDALGLDLCRTDIIDRGRFEALASEAIGDSQSEAALAAGRAMSLEDALALAVEATRSPVEQVAAHDERAWRATPPTSRP